MGNIKPTSVDVLIVGGGPAGMVCACLLARAGLETQRRPLPLSRTRAD